jgi:predicted DNA-binding transcriptional regulator AlpA|nr:helix-turn-helix domain-containing protein [uncultured Ruminococcus sp.]
MKVSSFKSYDELPLFIKAETLSDVLGLSKSSAYELMREEGFPSVRISSRIVVPKEAFIEWINQRMGQEK